MGGEFRSQRVTRTPHLIVSYVLTAHIHAIIMLGVLYRAVIKRTAAVKVRSGSVFATKKTAIFSGRSFSSSRYSYRMAAVSPITNEEFYIAAIDQGTSSSRVMIYDSKGQQVASHQVAIPHIKPKPGWVEIDPYTLLSSVDECCKVVSSQFPRTQLRALGVTNQRETTLVWDRTGTPLCNAITWLDTRTHDLVHQLIAKYGSRDHWRARTGLPITTYFSALKLKWLMEHVPAVKRAVTAGECHFGTVDSWLIWNLTRDTVKQVPPAHVTDVTNASRTLIYNINDQKWDEEICRELDIPLHVLPMVKSSAEIYGHVRTGHAFEGVPIAGCLGDQQSALVGQFCLQEGDAKNTYGTGCFLLYNTGTQAVQSAQGLLTTVAYQLGPQAPVHYALEGSVAVGGAVVDWLKDNLGIISRSSEIDEFASQVPDSGGVRMVPAFSGLFAPHWRADARGVIVGLTAYSTKHHIARAALESVAYQTADVVQAMQTDSGRQLTRLRVDGGLAKSALLMQTQADLLNIEVERPRDTETTARGCAIAAGLALGLWQLVGDHVGGSHMAGSQVFQPSISEDERVTRVKEWKKAIDRSLDWVERE